MVSIKKKKGGEIFQLSNNKIVFAQIARKHFFCVCAHNLLYFGRAQTTTAE